MLVIYISERFGSWLTPPPPGVFLKLLMPYTGNQDFLTLGEIWLLAHAFESRSQRLGAYLFWKIVNA